jgi:glutamyl-tRNA synthetase
VIFCVSFFFLSVLGQDFGDFIIWRGFDNIPSYEFAVVVDDIDMNITEIVRGEDLLLSTARQILLYEAFGIEKENYPKFYHCPLLRDGDGKRLAKRSLSKSIRSLRDEGFTPQRIIDDFFDKDVLKDLMIESA